MGNVFKRNSINPQQEQQRRRKSLMILQNQTKQVSRTNFKYISKFSSSGIDEQSIIWIAQNIQDPNQLFFVKQTDKIKAFNHKRIDSLKTQMTLFTNQDIPFINPCIYAFQDYQYLYMVSQYIQGYTLQEVIKQHSFTEQETKYVVMVLINIIDALHKRGYVIAQLSPQNLIVDKKTCSIKLIQLVNPLQIDCYYPSTIITDTSFYASPQVIVMDKICGEADFYSLGLIMYEMVTQKSAISALMGTNNQRQQDILNSGRKVITGLDRAAILRQQISVLKSDLPQGWNPQAIDMLIKLIIKNPYLRLGRYGSFQVRNHPWLQNSTNWHLFNKQSHNANNRQNLKTGQTGRNRKNRNQPALVNNSAISLVEQYFNEKRQIKRNLSTTSSASQKSRNSNQKLIENFTFQILFEKYQYKRDFRNMIMKKQFVREESQDFDDEQQDESLYELRRQ